MLQVYLAPNWACDRRLTARVEWWGHWHETLSAPGVAVPAGAHKKGQATLNPATPGSPSEVKLNSWFNETLKAEQGQGSSPRASSPKPASAAAKADDTGGTTDVRQQNGAATRQISRLGLQALAGLPTPGGASDTLLLPAICCPSVMMNPPSANLLLGSGTGPARAPSNALNVCSQCAASEGLPQAKGVNGVRTRAFGAASTPDSAAKRVRFSLKRNLYLNKGQPVPSADVRTPDSLRPKVRHPQALRQ